MSLPLIDKATPVLDLGCGTGAWLERLSREGFTNLCGIDNESFVALPKSNHFRCFHADLDHNLDLGSAGTSFGLVTAIEVLEHLHNPGWLFEQVAGHLAENGYFLITTPNLHSLRARIRFAFTGKLAGFDFTNVAADQTHVYPVLLTCLERILSRYGLRVAERWTYPANRGMGSRRWARVAEMISSMVLSNEYPGDSLCVLIRKDAAVRSNTSPHSGTA